MRIRHAIRGNASSALPARVVFLDTETVGIPRGGQLQEHVLRLGAACFWQRAGNKQPEREAWREFRHVDEFWQWIDRYAIEGKRLIVFAHNTQFDLAVLGGVEAAARHGWTVTKAVLDAERVILRVERGRASMLWLDWFNYFRGSLEATAQLLGLPYVALPAPADDDAAWMARCRNDVALLRAAVAAWLDLCEELDLGHFGHTLAAQALHAFRHRFMDHVPLIHNDRWATELERRAYMGGRCEAFRVGELAGGPWAMLDVNSMYPTVMASELYPRRLLYMRPRSTPAELWKLLETNLAIAEVRIRTDTPRYPAKIDGRLEFPIGEFNTVLTTPELRAALSRHELVAVGRVAVYEGAPIFARFVAELYPRRAAYLATGDRFREELLKRLMNSLYGKFGERIVKWDKRAIESEGPDDIWAEQDLDAGRERTFRRLGGVVEERQRESEGYNAFPAIPAHVTAYARSVLWSYMELAGRDHVAYVDTDALLVDARGLELLEEHLDETKLGRLKVKWREATVVIHGPKHYERGAERVQKGRSSSAVDLPSGKFTQPEFLSLSTALRAHHAGGPLVRQVERTPARPPMLERVQADGRVAPLRVGRGADGGVVRDDDGMLGGDRRG